MMGELHHRFSNSLQLIVSATNGILRQGGCSQEACERLQALQTRISLLADVNRILCGPYGPGSITKQALERLCTDLAAAFERSDFSVWVTVAGKAAGPENCRYMLLLVGELVTNALKHAAHDRELLVGIDVILQPTDAVSSFVATPPLRSAFVLGSPRNLSRQRGASSR